ncbi:YqeB family protein [Sciscionella marina]|uniref:YqeB family protein n=1 Tax=Sciscionella marina TaxID=508770 RepID=UPI00036491F7|nr:hypothetical protein [Sciscionella marina]
MSTTLSGQDRVSIPQGWLWFFRIIGLPVGLGIGFVLKPVVHWIVSVFSSAPAALRVAANIPTVWLVPLLTVLGLAGGIVLAEIAKREALTVTITEEGLHTAREGEERFIARAKIGTILLDGKDLVLIARDGREVFRSPATDLSTNVLAERLRARGYPQLLTADPHEAEYRAWLDGHPDLEDAAHSLLRERRSALKADNTVKAEVLRDRLQDNGIAVRDRNKVQQYRRL